MFQWSLTLSDKQVMMLIAFHNGEPDKDGSSFNSVHAMIADAWDVRAVRKLQEFNLLEVIHPAVREIGAATIWRITDKGRLIALAILEDAQGLTGIADRKGYEAASEINSDAHKRWIEKKEAKKNAR